MILQKEINIFCEGQAFFIDNGCLIIKSGVKKGQCCACLLGSDGNLSLLKIQQLETALMLLFWA